MTWSLFGKSKGQETNESACPYVPPTDGAKPAECPVKHDSRNNIPVDLPSTAVPDQSQPLNTKRQMSSIPRVDHEQGGDKWVYPSEQQFYNALHRKGKETDAADVAMIVAIHNDMNERTWREVLKWESLHADQCPGQEPKLLRFVGKPDELSPKARLYTTFGWAPRPFDRHDWVVSRCGGSEEVRYVIDYYEGATSDTQG